MNPIGMISADMIVEANILFNNVTEKLVYETSNKGLNDLQNLFDKSEDVRSNYTLESVSYGTLDKLISGEIDNYSKLINSKFEDDTNDVTLLFKLDEEKSAYLEAVFINKKKDK